MNEEFDPYPNTMHFDDLRSLNELTIGTVLKCNLFLSFKIAMSLAWFPELKIVF